MGVTFTETDQTFVAKKEAGMLLAFVGLARRGPTTEDEGGPVTLQSDTDVDKHLGAGSASYNAPGIIKYVIGKGATVKFVRAILTGTTASRDIVDIGAVAALRISARNDGTWGNLISATIGADPSGNAALFSLTLTFSEQPTLNAVYYNLSMDPTLANFVENVINDVSPLVRVTALTAVRPANIGPLALTGGLVNDTATPTEYQAALTLFDSERYLTHLASDSGNGTIWSNQTTYCSTRGTITQLQSVPFGYTADQAAQFRQGTGGYGFAYVDSSYTALYWGDVKTKRNGSVMPVPEWCHPLILGKYATKMGTGQPWFAVAGATRGRISEGYGMRFNVLGKTAETTLTGLEVNPLVTDSDPDTGAKYTKIAESLTCQRARSQRRFAEVRELLNWIKRRFLYHQTAIEFEPNDPQAWRNLYVRMKKDLDECGQNRGLDGVEGIGYEYVGDQDAVTRQQATYNSQDDLADGKYKVAIYLVSLPGIRDLALNTVLTKTSAQFAESD
jgi:hypothetical protein